MPLTLPLLATSTIGSYAVPSWLVTALEAIRDGHYGPRDVVETVDDAVRIAVGDQQRAGVDLLVDGEMRRLDFVMGFYDYLGGVEALPQQRRLGAEGHDQRPRWRVVRELTAPRGLGVVDEFQGLRVLVGDAPIKVTCPGPFTLAGRLDGDTIYKDRMAVATALAEIVNAELRAVVAAGAEWVQLDEPSYAVYPDRPFEFVALINKTLDGVAATRGLHMCFGNWRGRPVAKRSYRPLFPALFDAAVDQFCLEFANREMAEVELLAEIPSDRSVAAGLVDVKNYYVETPEDVAERIRTCLRHLAPDRLHVTPDCGFSQTARWAASAKLTSMVDGTRLVRRQLRGEVA